MQIINRSGIARIMSLLVIGTGFASSAVNAATTQSTSVFLTGKDKSFGNGVDLSVNSGNWQLDKSKRYAYSLDATISGVAPKKKPKPGTLTMKDLIPAGTKVTELIDLIAPGYSSLFNGTYSNPDGTLPVVLVDRKVSGTETLPGIGKLSISLNLKAEILENGQVVISATNVSIKTAAGKVPGTIKFGRGSKVVISTAPIVEFKSVAQNVDENAGSVKVTVWRQGNRKVKANATWTTEGDTAIADVDFKTTSGTVKFKKNQTQKTISIPILDNELKDGFKTFKIKLAGDPEELGSKTEMSIGIKDND